MHNSIKHIRLTKKTLLIILTIFLFLVVLTAFTLVRKNHNVSYNQKNTCSKTDENIVKSINSTGKVNYTEIKNEISTTNLCNEIVDYQSLSDEEKIAQFKANSILSKESLLSGDKKSSQIYAKASLVSFDSLPPIKKQDNIYAQEVNDTVLLSLGSYEK